MARFESLRIKTDGATLDVRPYGGSGDPIVLLHGGPGMGNYFDAFPEVLSPPYRVVSYNLQKNFDGAVSMGPCITVGETDHQDVDAETRVNGVVRQSYSTKEMIWSFGEVLEYLSQDFSFVPGDVIAGGTSAGTAADKSRRGPDGKRPLDLFLKIGDTVEVSSSKIGALSNKIVASE